MTDVGLASGDPCAADHWSREQRIRARAWGIARQRGAVSTWASSRDDLVRWFDLLLDRFAGLRDLVVSGIVGVFGVRRR